jgi:hypothetical protein
MGRANGKESGKAQEAQPTPALPETAPHAVELMRTRVQVLRTQRENLAARVLVFDGAIAELEHWIGLAEAKPEDAKTQ